VLQRKPTYDFKVKWSVACARRRRLKATAAREPAHRTGVEPARPSTRASAPDGGAGRGCSRRDRSESQHAGRGCRAGVEPARPQHDSEPAHRTGVEPAGRINRVGS